MTNLAACLSVPKLDTHPSKGSIGSPSLRKRIPHYTGPESSTQNVG